jgi:SecD/SecF fusion protein
MGRNLAPKVGLIIVLVAVAGWTLYPPSMTLKPGIDLAGGTSLIYEIDTEGLAEQDRKDLAQRMIAVLRRRIDPDNILNLVWRPQGNTRFEIQMPLASAEAREKRQKYEKTQRDLLEENINLAKVMRYLEKPEEERAAAFQELAQGWPKGEEILNELAEAYDEREELQNQRDKLFGQLENIEDKIAAAGLDVEEIKGKRADWSKLNEQELTEELSEFLGSENNLDLLTNYIKTYGQWADVVEQLTAPETGANERYRSAKRKLDELNLSKEQIKLALEMRPGSAGRRQALEELKMEFADRAEKIDKVVAAFDEYLPDRGRLDDPKDLQRMLKGAGILEFRILPTLREEEVDADEMVRYVERLKEKGPKYASDDKYVWCEIENINKWAKGLGIVAPFGDKYYVLTSNKKDETILHGGKEKDWSLKRAYPTRDPDTGQRAIGFTLDERGGRLFRKVTTANMHRPLCIVLDDIAISAPTIEAKVGKEGIIRGRFTETEIADMVNKLNAGSLPARLREQPISLNSIGPSIGADNRDKGIQAGFIGLVVMSCMLFYYTLAGSIADVALLMNILFVLAIMAGVRATFTLPGIAGIILTIGMSVDANVLIFERIREEQQKGCSLRIAIKNGYQRAFRAIFDANLTTFITAAILYWRASEEIKGFAIVLMLGIASSMFTALFVTRTVFDLLLSKRLIKDHLFMLRLIHEPKVNWMAARPIFLSLSSVLIAAGLLVFFTRDDTKNNKYDIEFTGGTSVQINLKDNVNLSRSEVEDKIHQVGEKLNNAALATANVYSVGESGKRYELTTTETNKTTATITFPESGEASEHTVESIILAIKEAEADFRRKLSNLRVTKVSESSAPTDSTEPAGARFVISTSQISPTLVENILSTAFPQAEISEPQVDEVVNDAIKTAFAGQLEILENLGPEIVTKEKISEELVGSYPELVDFLGGIKIECEIEEAATIEELERRLADLQFKPDMRELNWDYDNKILDSNLNEPEPNQPINSFVYVSAHPEAGLRELSDEEWGKFVENETTKVLAATKLETSLPRVTQIDPSVGAEQRNRALIAIVLSLFAIVSYVWIRFGNVRYGIAAITALVHDVCITLGAVTACTYIAATSIGEKLLIGDFKINLAMIAAFLTLIGYSLNDTIVVFDRIRENRRKALLNPQIITNSINQTISRTLLTSFTTFIVVLIMYIFGGSGLRGFTFAIGFGVIIGTYSSIAIAAPILLLGAKTGGEKSKPASKQ